MRSIESKTAGFTLLELVLTMMIMGIISIVVGRILFHGYNNMLTSENVSNTAWQGLIALEKMTNDVHRVRSTSDMTTIAASQLTFTDVSGATVQYTVSGSTLLRNDATLASGVNSLTFAYLDGNGVVTSTAASVRYIRMSLGLTKGGFTLSMSTMAGMRI